MLSHLANVLANPPILPPHPYSPTGDYIIKPIIVKLGGTLPPTMLHLTTFKVSSTTTKEFVPLPELRSNITQPMGVSKSTLYKKLDGLVGDKRREAPLHLLATLKRIGAVPHKSPKCELVTLVTAVKLLNVLHVSQVVTNSLMAKVLATDYLSSSSSSDSSDDDVATDDMSDDADDVEVIEDDDESGAPAPVADQGADDLADLADLADQEAVLDASRYGLTSIKSSNKKKACMSVIQLEMTHFQAWSQALYQPGRPLEFKQQSSKTWESQQKRVYEYLGYLYHHRSIPRPRLTNYLNTEDFTTFLDFLKARGVDKAGHTKAVHAAIRSVTFIKGLPTTDQGQAKVALQVLKDLGSQLGQNMVPMPKSKDPEQLKEQGRWLDAPQLMARVEAVRVQALSDVQGMKAGNVPRLEAAKAVHNALLAAMCFGYMPPLRHNSVLLTITAPPHHGCIHPDCQHKHAGCLGNRVYRHSSTGLWWLDVPHHKNTRAWNGVAIKFQLPLEVAELLEHHLTWAHRSLTGMVEDVAPTLFVNTTTGMPIRTKRSHRCGAGQCWRAVVCTLDLSCAGAHLLAAPRTWTSPTQLGWQ